MKRPRLSDNWGRCVISHKIATKPTNNLCCCRQIYKYCVRRNKDKYARWQQRTGRAIYLYSAVLLRISLDENDVSWQEASRHVFPASLPFSLLLTPGVRTVRLNTPALYDFQPPLHLQTIGVHHNQWDACMSLAYLDTVATNSHTDSFHVWQKTGLWLPNVFLDGGNSQIFHRTNDRSWCVNNLFHKCISEQQTIGCTNPFMRPVITERPQ